MKKLLAYLVTVLVAGTLISSSACTKIKEGEDDQNSGCKTCKTYARNHFSSAAFL
jgi:hypothetical protein